MSNHKPNQDADQAADVIRAKLNALYEHEPSAKRELSEATVSPHRSRHQQFIYNLSSSGKSLADIQVEWHKYYEELSDSEKHKVWQEFYNDYNLRRSAPAAQQPAMHTPAPVFSQRPLKQQALHDRIVSQVRAQSQKTKQKQHAHSLLFGLSSGFIAVAFLLFGLFNERVIAPFITPSRSVSNTPIIVDPNSSKVSKDPKIIIPKINVEIPVVYDEQSIEEDDVQKALERGVLHYSTTPNPGEQGNAVIFGHSSNNIFNSGQYKFAFVLLKQLEKSDIFMLHKDGVRYVYKVIDKKVVSPSEVSVIGSVSGKKATATLITCDPPGTSLNRLVVVGEQISPEPGSNAKSSAVIANSKPTVLPSNSPSIWSRFWNWLAH